MRPSDPFVEHLVDLLTLLGPVQARRMFGGCGLYLDGTIFAIVSDDTLYLKADAENRPAFEAAGTGPFTYEGRSGLVALPYWEAPPALLEDGEELCRWARRAYEASLRARAARPPKRRKAAVQPR